MSTKSPAAPGANRPLSPFMIGRYYRPQLTSMLSITHRATGVLNLLGGVLLAVWLNALASGPAVYADFAKHLTAWYGQALLFVWTWSLLYHLCNGVRHLVWDAGHGLDLKTAYRSGYAVIAVSVVLTIGAWTIALA